MVFELTESRLIIKDGVEEAGYIFFDEHDTHYVVTYIFVKPEYRGQGLAHKLVDRFVQLAQETNRKIVPICSVTGRILQRHYPTMLL